MRDYYRILGIRPDATQAEIKEAWNFSIKAFHPDKFAGSSQRQRAVLSHTTELTFECRPADEPPFLVQEIESPYSDDDRKVESGADGQQQKLSATDLFDLRTKCAACAKKVLQANYPDLMPGIAARLSSSHYHPKSGRCFVELKVWNIPKDPSIEPETYHQLFDGQTEQELAGTQVYKNGERHGVVKVESIYDFVGTEYYIKR